jgi:hypothetical protein
MCGSTPIGCASKLGDDDGHLLKYPVPGIGYQLVEDDHPSLPVSKED